MKRLPLVYVAGPFRGKTSWQMEQNIRRAEELALAVWEAGAACICPHANTRFFQGECSDSTWIDGDLEILYRCDALLLTPEWPLSPGARGEKEFADRLGIPVFTTLFDLRLWIGRKLMELQRSGYQAPPVPVFPLPVPVFPLPVPAFMKADAEVTEETGAAWAAAKAAGAEPPTEAELKESIASSQAAVDAAAYDEATWAAYEAAKAAKAAGAAAAAEAELKESIASSQAVSDAWAEWEKAVDAAAAQAAVDAAQAAVDAALKAAAQAQADELKEVKAAWAEVLGPEAAKERGAL